MLIVLFALPVPIAGPCDHRDRWSTAVGSAQVVTKESKGEATQSAQVWPGSADVCKVPPDCNGSFSATCLRSPKLTSLASLMAFGISRYKCFWHALGRSQLPLL